MPLRPTLQRNADPHQNEDPAQENVHEASSRLLIQLSMQVRGSEQHISGPWLHVTRVDSGSRCTRVLAGHNLTSVARLAHTPWWVRCGEESQPGRRARSFLPLLSILTGLDPAAIKLVQVFALKNQKSP